MFVYRARPSLPASLWGSLLCGALALLVVGIVIGSTPVSACDAQGIPCLLPLPAATEDPGGHDTGGDDTSAQPAETVPCDPAAETCASDGRSYGPALMKGDICITRGTRVAVEGTRLSVYSDFGADTPNGMLITALSLTAIPSLKEADKTSQAPVILVVKSSEYAPGWGVTLYWSADHYGVLVFHDGTLFDDTGAVCGWF